MITDQFVKDEFVSEILRRDIGIIYKTQEEVANRYFKEHTGTLRDFLSRRAFSLQELLLSGKPFPHIKVKG